MRCFIAPIVLVFWGFSAPAALGGQFSLGEALETAQSTARKEFADLAYFQLTSAQLRPKSEEQDAPSVWEFRWTPRREDQDMTLVVQVDPASGHASSRREAIWERQLRKVTIKRIAWGEVTVEEALEKLKVQLKEEWPEGPDLEFVLDDSCRDGSSQIPLKLNARNLPFYDLLRWVKLCTGLSYETTPKGFRIVSAPWVEVPEHTPAGELAKIEEILVHGGTGGGGIKIPYRDSIVIDHLVTCGKDDPIRGRAIAMARAFAKPIDALPDNADRFGFDARTGVPLTFLRMQFSWSVLFATGVLHDGMSYKETVVVLGKPTLDHSSYSAKRRQESGDYIWSCPSLNIANIYIRAFIQDDGTVRFRGERLVKPSVRK